MNESGFLTYYIHELINTKDKNYNLGIFGKVGSGKSLSGVVLAKKIDKYFTIKDDILYDKDDYFKRVDYLVDAGISKGRCVLLDEAGANIMEADKWWDTNVQAVTNQMRTGRYNNICCIIVSPMFKDIVNKARPMLDGYMKPQKKFDYMGAVKFKTNIDDRPDRNFSYWNFYHNESDSETSEMMKNLMSLGGYNFGWEDGIIRNIKFKYPPKEVVDAYKVKSFEFKNMKRKQSKEKIKQELLTKGTNIDKVKIAEELYPDVLANRELWFAPRAKKVNIHRICRICGVGGRVAEQIGDVLNEKLYKDGLLNIQK